LQGQLAFCLSYAGDSDNTGAPHYSRCALKL
jgi:hypothetical protein